MFYYYAFGVFFVLVNTYFQVSSNPKVVLNVTKISQNIVTHISFGHRNETVTMVKNRLHGYSIRFCVRLVSVSL